MKQTHSGLLSVVNRCVSLFGSRDGHDVPVVLTPRLRGIVCLGIFVTSATAGSAISQSNKYPITSAVQPQSTLIKKLPAQNPATRSTAAVDSSSYTIGPGDVLAISFSNSPELNHKVQVGQTGDISVPLLSTPIHAAGLTPLQLSDKIGTTLEDAGQLRNPYVSIYVEEHNSHFVTVLGAVEHPGLYPLARPTTLLELISRAGGLTTSAGATLTVVHATDEQRAVAAKGPSHAQALAIRLSDLKDNNDPSLNFLLQSGDVVNVSSAPTVYVVGAVGKPGGFVVHDAQSGITILQALAMAEGLQPMAAGAHSLVIRHPSGRKERLLIPIDIGKLMKGKAEDRELQANDILFVPESQTKKNLQVLVRTAEASASAVAGYGLGVRLGGR